jgi:RNA polymerase sigma-70 factor (ECF subfamily)
MELDASKSDLSRPDPAPPVVAEGGREAVREVPVPAAPPGPKDLKSDEEPDSSLMRKAIQGDMGAYAVLFKRHADRIWRMAYMILHSAAAAEDVVQETFTRGLLHINSYRGEAEPRAWFSSIAFNMCRHYLRDKNKEAELADSQKLERGCRIRRPRTRGALSSAIRRESNRLLAVALGYLTEAQREVFVLHYVDELPYEDVARILDIRAGAARALAHRAKAVLQKKLGVNADLLRRD